jgi:hypothetical protein
MDHRLWGDRTGKKGTLPRRERWPKQYLAKRKFDGKWYTLEGVERYREDAEEIARTYREGVYDPERGWATYYARVVPAPADKYSKKYLVYVRPKPLSPEKKSGNRKLQKVNATLGNSIDRMWGSASAAPRKRR